MQACIAFFKVNMANNMNRGRVSPTTKNGKVMQHGSHEVAKRQLTGNILGLGALSQICFWNPEGLVCSYSCSFTVLTAILH